MDETTLITALVERLRTGDPQAAAQLFALYAQRLTRLAEQHLSQRLAGREDGEDVVQSVFRTFFRRGAAGEFHIDSSTQIWQLLVKITLRKASARGRRHTAEQRNVGAEQPGLADAWLAEVADHQPGPAEAADLLDQIETLLRGLPQLYGQVLEMRLQGFGVSEVASRLGLARQTIYRVLQLLQHRLQRSCPDI